MKKRNVSILILMGCMLRMLPVFAQPIPPQVGGTIDIYILMGQSNMAGRGKLADASQGDTSQRVLMFNKARKWVTAKHPLHFDKTVAGVGPGLQFGLYLAAADGSIQIGLVPTAVGGSSINAWQPGAFDSATKTHPYDDAVERIKDAMRYGMVKGVIWLQGESNTNYDAERYIGEFEKLVANLRQVTDNPTLPFVVGELGQFREAYKTFNKTVLAQIPARIKYTQLVHSDNLSHGGDSVHFNTASADMYGKRFAEAMLQLKRQ